MTGPYGCRSFTGNSRQAHLMGGLEPIRNVGRELMTDRQFHNLTFDGRARVEHAMSPPVSGPFSACKGGQRPNAVSPSYTVDIMYIRIYDQVYLGPRQSGSKSRQARRHV